jgi:hypothetical protein
MLESLLGSWVRLKKRFVRLHALLRLLRMRTLTLRTDSAKMKGHMCGSKPDTLGPRSFNPILRKNIGKFAWSFRYTNYGKTPAHRLHFTEEAFRFGVSGKFQNTPGFSKVKVVPTPLAPTEENFVTKYSKEITQKEFTNYAAIDKGISIRGTMKYTDASGTPYESDICLTMLANGQIAFCEGNDIH